MGNLIKSVHLFRKMKTGPVFLAAALSLATAKPWSKVGVIDGEKANQGEFPWIVSLRSFSVIGFTHFCGGSIVGDQWIVTAGHCCYGNSDGAFIHAMAGGVKLDLPESGVQKVNIDKVLLHQDFNYTLIQNDICLLKTKTAFEWTDTVKAVDLPESMAETEAGVVGQLAGWGEDGIWPVPAEHLRKTSVPVMSDSDCNATYLDYDAKYNLPNVVLDSMICLQDPNDVDRGSCSGDSGGPFTVNGTLTGLVSWGAGGCASSGYPSVMTQLSYFITWIQETMNDN